MGANGLANFIGAVLVNALLSKVEGHLLQILAPYVFPEGGLYKIPKTFNDEIGYTGDVINEMTDGLIEREKIQQSLHLAREVQQNLLPKSNLKVNGFDIAGKSVYCDETGGDYYDFIIIGDASQQKIIDVIFDIVDKFVDEVKIEDDITSVIIKMQN